MALSYETPVLIRATQEGQQTYVLRREGDEWLAFQDQTHTITSLGNVALEHVSLDGEIVRIVDNEPIEGALTAPLKLFLSVSDKCNLTCDHCMSSSSPHGEQTMSNDDLKLIADEAAEMGVFQITIGGGEPLVYRGLWNVVSHMRELHLGVSMTTNAYVVKDEDIENIKRYSVKTNVSIDGAPQTHDKIRNKQGAYDRSIANIRRMIDAGIYPTLRYTMMRSNLADVDHMIELSKDLGLTLKPRRAKPSGRVLENSEIITEADQSYFEAVIKLNNASDCGIEDLMNLDPNTEREFVLGNADCGAGTRLAFIDEDSTISPCTFLGKDYQAGKWQPGKLKDAWLGADSFAELRNLPENEECSSCSRHSTCHSECPAMRLHTGGSLDADDPGCIKPLVQYLGDSIPIRRNNV